MSDMTSAMEGQPVVERYRFPALDPEPPPASLGRRVATVAIIAVVSAGFAGMGFALSGSGGTTHTGSLPPGVPSTGRVLVLTPTNQLAIARPDGSHASVLANIGAFGQGLPSVSTDRRFLAGSDDRIISLAPAEPAVLPTQLQLGSTHILSPIDPFADHDLAVIDVGTGQFGSATASSDVNAVTLANGTVTRLGIASRAAGDPQRLGAFAVVPGSEVGSSGGDQVEPPDASVELRDAGSAPVPLISAAAASAAVGLDPSMPVLLSPWPDPQGDKVAITVAPSSGLPVEGVVVVDRAGTLEGEILASVGPSSGARVTWSPDGSSIAYVAAGASGFEIATWTLGGAVSVRNIPVGDPGAALCIWSPDGTALLCPAAAATEFPTDWYLADSSSGPIAEVRASGFPLAWLTTPAPRGRRA